jgi:uncharacterized membrane protein YeaQ/YmgE (transglycosylase-associated protein family)
MPVPKSISTPFQGDFMLATLLQIPRHIGPVETRSLIGWLILGLLAGWLAGKISRGRGFGCITDIVLGLIGGVLGGWIFTKLGMVGYSSSFLYSLAAATVGAVIIVAIAHLFSSGS